MSVQETIVPMTSRYIPPIPPPTSRMQSRPALPNETVDARIGKVILVWMPSCQYSPDLAAVIAGTVDPTAYRTY